MNRYFFQSSRDAHEEIERLFDFMWPTAAAMWNMRWQVKGYLEAVEGVTDNQLKARFTEGSGIRRANLRRSCVQISWHEQQEVFAGFVLANTIAVYESWVEALLDELNTTYETYKIPFVSIDNREVGTRGIVWAIQSLTASESVIMKAQFYDAAKSQADYSMCRVPMLMTCFRFYKELRNAAMHGGGRAKQRLIEAYQRFEPNANIGDLGVSEVPEHVAPILDQKTPLSLRGVVGFTSVIHKLIATVDAECLRAANAEVAFLTRWREHRPKLVELTKRGNRHITRVEGVCSSIGFPKPADANALCEWLNVKGLVRFTS